MFQNNKVSYDVDAFEAMFVFIYSSVKSFHTVQRPRINVPHFTFLLYIKTLNEVSINHQYNSIWKGSSHIYILFICFPSFSDFYNALSAFIIVCSFVLIWEGCIIPEQNGISNFNEKYEESKSWMVVEILWLKYRKHCCLNE